MVYMPFIDFFYYINALVWCWIWRTWILFHVGEHDFFSSFSFVFYWYILYLIIYTSITLCLIRSSQISIIHIYHNIYPISFSLLPFLWRTLFYYKLWFNSFIELMCLFKMYINLRTFYCWRWVHLYKDFVSTVEYKIEFLGTPNQIRTNWRRDIKTRLG